MLTKFLKKDALFYNAQYTFYCITLYVIFIMSNSMLITEAPMGWLFYSHMYPLSDLDFPMVPLM